MQRLGEDVTFFFSGEGWRREGCAFGCKLFYFDLGNLLKLPSLIFILSNPSHTRTLTLRHKEGIMQDILFYDATTLV